MNRKDFDYFLPKKLIAQTPIKARDNSRLYFLDRKTDKEKHLHFYDILNIIPKNAILVINDTKVIAARMHAKKISTNANIEVLYLSHNKNELSAIVRPKKRLKIGTKLAIGNKLELVVKSFNDEVVNFTSNLYDDNLIKEIEKNGKMPLPPYIKETLEDSKRYQTVYANRLESSAAPTAGLHFTRELLRKLEEKGVQILKISLKVGLATFSPIKKENLLEHKMHYEKYEISNTVAKKLNHAKENNIPIIAVGTTVVRALEANYLISNKITPGTFMTNLFIYPGFKFNVVDHLITNFHLPKSTLLCLISAFYKREKILKHYENAISNNYRFFSFGDAMFLW